MFYLPLLQRSKIGQHTGWGAAEVKGVASRRAECLLTCEFSDLSLTNIVPLDFIEGYLQAAAVKIATKLSLKSCSFQFRLRLTNTYRWQREAHCSSDDAVAVEAIDAGSFNSFLNQTLLLVLIF